MRCEQKAREMGAWLRLHPEITSYVVLVGADLNCNWADCVRAVGVPVFEPRSVLKQTKNCLSEFGGSRTNLGKSPKLFEADTIADTETAARTREEPAESHAYVSWPGGKPADSLREVPDEDGWMLCHEILVDSESGQRVCAVHDFPGVALEPGADPRLLAGNGQKLRHYGCKTVPLELEDGTVRWATFQVCDVLRPIVSVEWLLRRTVPATASSAPRAGLATPAGRAD